jgi:hypothetical protein
MSCIWRRYINTTMQNLHHKSKQTSTLPCRIWQHKGKEITTLHCKILDLIENLWSIRTTVAVSKENLIHNDIAISILSKLPRKSLKRLTCDCSPWFILFENHQFMKMFRDNLFSNFHCCSYYDGSSLHLKVNESYKYISVFSFR